jgi:uncharacterized 2Fe-2S/4Fe-4S cluster protein (DUF4445 family)
MEAAMAGNAGELASLIRSALDGMIRTACTDTGISPDEIGGAVITGNTVMLSLLTEQNVEGMTHAPFDPPSLFGYETDCEALGLRALPPRTPVALPPCIGAFLGADLVCAILGSGMTHLPAPSLLADIGTNGEMALWDGEALYTTSTAAGPAFEGGGISMGMRGEKGAIDRVSLCGSILSCHVIGEESARGKGIGTSAAKLMIEYGFKELGLHRIYLRVLAGNEQAVRSYEKAGFVKEGYLKNDAYINGKYVDIVWMAIVNEEK